MLAEKRAWNLSHPDYHAEYRASHKAEIAKSNREWQQANKDRVRANKRRWREENKERINENKRSRLRDNPTIRIANTMSTMMRRALRGNKQGAHWETLAGYDLAALKSHLQSLLQPGMTFENYGLWHIDHAKPIIAHSFNSYKDAEFKECFALSNLQPLWAHDNLSKNDRWNPDDIPQKCLAVLDEVMTESV